MSYRFDNRTKSEFKRDIKTSHKKEVEIAARIRYSIKLETGLWPSIIPAGVDFTGEFIEKDKEVIAGADFIIDCEPMDITRADTLCAKYFHQKSNKIIKCIKEGFSIVFVNGYCVNEEPEFTIISSKEIEKLTDKSLKKYDNVLMPGRKGSGVTGKTAYRYDLGWITSWQKLPKMPNKMPKEYKELLKSV